MLAGFAFPAVALAAVVTAAAASPAAAQSMLAAGGAFESYTFADPTAAGVERISLATTPFVARLGLGRRMTAEVVSHYARASLVRADGSEATLSGPTDTDVRLSVRVTEALTLTGAFAVPTGNATHSLEEAEIAGIVAADLLPFRVSNWGSGGGGRIQAALAMPVGQFGVGLVAGYGVAREFEPLLDDQRAYLPGNELSVRLAVDRTFARSSKLALQFGMHRFDEDALDGQNLYRSGNRYEGMGSFSFAAGRTSSGVVYAGVLRRESGTLLLETSPTTGQTAAQDLILVGTGFRVRAGRSTTLLPALDGRVFRSEDGVGQGYTLGLGLGAELGAGSFRFVPSARARFGRLVVRDDVESGLRGFEAAITVRFGSLR
jgi:hypothetical protein